MKKTLLALLLCSSTLQLTACGGSSSGGGGGTTSVSLNDAIYAEDGATTATSPVVALDSSRNIFVAWIENPTVGSSGSKVYCWKYSGSSWTAVGEGVSASSNLINVTSLRLSIRSDGNPVIAWAERQGDIGGQLNIYMRRWDGSNWQSYGSPGYLSAGDAVGSITTDVENFDLKLNSENNPVIAWKEQYSTNGILSGLTRGIFAEYWTGSEWQGFSTDSIADSGNLATAVLDGPSLALIDDAPVIAYTSTTGIKFARWTGAAWNSTPYGSTPLVISSSNTVRFNPALLLNSSEEPVAVWWEEDSSLNIYAHEWDGSAWDALGSDSGKVSAFTESDSSSYKYTLTPVFNNAGELIVAWSYADTATGGRELTDPVTVTSPGGVEIRRFNGSSWVAVGTIPLRVASNASLAHLGVSFPTLAYDSTANQVIVAWTEILGLDTVVYVRKISL